MKNILRNFWLTLSRFKTASILNILGLTVAFSVFIVIMSQTYWELTYNKGIKQHERIFRLIRKNSEELSFVSSRPLGEAIGKSSPSIETYTAFTHRGNLLVKTLETNGRVKEIQTSLVKVSSSVTDLLSLECLAGDFKRMEEPKTAIIAKSLADILFSDSDPIGNIIITENNDTLKIAAVYKDLPKNCTFKNGIFSNIGDYCIADKYQSSFVYFYKLNTLNGKSEVEMQANKIMQEMFPTSDEEEEDEEEEATSFHLEPFSNLYYSEVESYFDTGNRILTRLLTSIAILIMLITIINYINFFMALVPIRIRSVNIHKVFGTPISAQRWNFISEAVGLLLLSFGLALLMIEYLSETSINNLIVNSLKLKENIPVLCITGIFSVVAGILSGLFPAFYITKFNPAFVLKGSFGRSKQGQRFRSILIIFQFTISILLIIVASFIYLQNCFMQKYDYGFNRERLVTVQVGSKIASQPQTFLSELRKNPSIEGIAYAFSPIVEVGMSWGRPFNGEQIDFSYMPVSWNYPEFMGFTLKEGRFFMEDDASKIGGTIIFNETAAKKYNIKVGDFIQGHSVREKAEVVGIIKDFNFTSLQNSIDPFALYEFGCTGWRVPSLAYIRLNTTADFKQTANFIASAMQAVNPDMDIDKISIMPFDESIENLYTKEINLTKIISLFSLVAILISLMGVFGIVVFENQHRRKEIALRKIHGSTTALILGMFNRKFIIILAISAMIAIPIAYFGITKWLSGFAYKTPIYWWVFAGGFLVVAFITLLTVTLQTFHVANENPINSIKSE